MRLSVDVLSHTMPQAGSRIDLFYPHLARSMESYGVIKTIEIAAFLATIAEESGELHWILELWGPTVAQLGYEHNLDLGNTQTGDGARFKGRGLIQITGRSNYQRMGELMDLPLLDKPELLQEPVYATYSACAFWWENSLNAIADRSDFRSVTRRVNGGLTNIARREIYYERAKQALGI